MAGVSDWALFGALILLGWVLKLAVSTVYLRVRAQLDRDHPDDLPLGAGDWVRSVAAARGISVDVLAAPSRERFVDAFMPTASKIILAQETYFKKDPSFWAVAAHELGHAMFHRALPGLDVVLVSARVFGKGAAYVGTFLVAANVLYAEPAISELGLGLLVVSLALQVIVLVDEAAASVIANRNLSAEPLLDATDIRGARATLAVAFLTYLAGFIGLAILVLERQLISRIIAEHRHFEPADPAGMGRLVLAGALSLLLVLASWGELRQVMRPPYAADAAAMKKRMGVRSIAELLRSFVGISLVALVWDQPLGLLFAIACVLGVLASRTAVGVLALIATKIVLLVAAIAVLVIFSPLRVLRHPGGRKPAPIDMRPGDATPRAAAPPGEAPPSQSTHADVIWSASQLEQTELDRFNNPPWFERLSRLGYLVAHIGFVIVLWVCLLMRN